ncbi:MAG: ricin-type beta-trefoil lectin domain protein [Brevundimonas sp.]|uniref:ricin-type beta-trefoil lectin domain protein n=1 Tax=Brevundimonas sp. TaxID=1871086 RepID=UPI0025B7C802|nr:ricin-type beta-trefoil lectin domain protein [Brevundimonas sp.]MBX3478407.1 ricin-type beta-trefoil lectin domain protein [Brevundimonas sp.]
MSIVWSAAELAGAFASVAISTQMVTLQPERLPGMCLSMTGREGQAESRECDGSPAQEIELPGAEGGPIRHAGKCLAPRGGGLYPELFAEACDGSPAQTWRLPSSGEVRNGEGRCLALLGLSSRSGERVYAGDCPVRVEPQGWRQVDATQQTYRNMTGRFELVGREGQCLAWIDAGNFLGLAPCADVSEQRFSFNAAQHGQFRIKSGCLAAGFLDGGMNIGDCGRGREKMWLHRGDQTLVNGLGLCATVESQSNRDVIRNRPCRPGRIAQQWRFVAITE